MNIVTKIFLFLIGFSCFSQQEIKDWITYSNDSIVVAKHYWNDAKMQLDSITINSKGNEFRLPKFKQYEEEQLLSIYKDSLSMPFDFALPLVTSIKRLNKSILIVAGHNKGIQKMFSYYIHILLINTEKNEIMCWVVARASRGNYDPIYIINDKKKQLIIPKENNYIREEKIYSLNPKKTKYKEIYLSQKIKFINDKYSRTQNEISPVFSVFY